MVTIVDPHLKRDENYYIHKEATSKGLYVKNKDGTDFDGWCWPGQSSYLDFTNPKVTMMLIPNIIYSISTIKTNQFGFVANYLGEDSSYTPSILIPSYIYIMITMILLIDVR
jgi:hypothetical protein